MLQIRAFGILHLHFGLIAVPFDFALPRGCRRMYWKCALDFVQCAFLGTRCPADPCAAPAATRRWLEEAHGGPSRDAVGGDQWQTEETDKESPRRRCSPPLMRRSE